MCASPARRWTVLALAVRPPSLYSEPMRLEDVVNTSSAVTEVSSRLEKIDRLGALLKRLDLEEVPLAIAYLSGRLPQGRVGIGGSGVWQAKPDTAADEATLQLGEVDDTFERIAHIGGPG